MTELRPTPIDRLAAVADRYDAYIVDLWGVVHDGKRPYPGVLDCFAAFKRAGKHTLLLSNAPRRAHAAVTRLAELGVARDLYDEVLTSGEDAWHALRTRGRPDAAPFYRDLGRRCFLFGAPRDLSLFEDIDVERVADIAMADFILCTNLFDYGDRPANHEETLRQAAARGQPMICANPDLVVVHGEALEYCAGAVAELYEQLGGKVVYHGKPHAQIYARARAMLGGAAPRRVLCVGDSLRTDIAGANGAGLDSLLVVGGIHREEFAGADGNLDMARLEAACGVAGAWPTWVGAGLLW
ncbi:MAG: TIGR01459 family HAD-type hydrolase [Alphaproteobacteria bacterium]|nr:TIGR01459 family HAD-type hydrolase [Alphaproteobacteria bacterium]